MLQRMDHMVASYVFYTKFGMFDQVEQNKLCVVTFSTLGIALQTVLHDFIVSICFMYDSRDLLKETSPDILSIEECPL